MRIWIAGAGQRGSHGCNESFIVEGTIIPANDGVHDYIVTGKIIEHTICAFCGGENLEGKYVEWKVYYDPEYYGHDGYQL